jgi:hypothetical protein
MGWAQGLVDALNKALDWGRTAWNRSNAKHDEAIRRKADIDARHVERRDLSKDKRPR